YHPILATRADTREALHIRLRKGSANTQKGMLRFCDELIARVGRAGASGVKLLRADAGFWNTKVFERLEQAGWQYSIGVRIIKTIRVAVAAIDENAWQHIDYPDDGEAQIAQITYAGRRLIVRRTRLLGAQAELWPDWRRRPKVKGPRSSKSGSTTRGHIHGAATLDRFAHKNAAERPRQRQGGERPPSCHSRGPASTRSSRAGPLRRPPA
ncbi:MAG: transposase, partial [Actinobacteria bacterium]|nr:transposase [Actinomycetota bacterium]